MKKLLFILILFSLFFIAISNVTAQNLFQLSFPEASPQNTHNIIQFPSHNAMQRLSAEESTTVTFDPSERPQWVKDLRRFDIIAFGTFPFSMFLAFTITDLIRWGNANGFDTSAEGRRYAPWPAKSAGAVEMTNDEYLRTVLFAAGISVAAALIDFIIVKVKRSKEIQRLESESKGTVTIERTSPESESETESAQQAEEE